MICEKNGVNWWIFSEKSRANIFWGKSKKKKQYENNKVSLGNERP